MDSTPVDDRLWLSNIMMMMLMMQTPFQHQSSDVMISINTCKSFGFTHLILSDDEKVEFSIEKLSEHCSTPLFDRLFRRRVCTSSVEW